MGKPTCLAVARSFAEKVTGFYGKVRESPRSFTKVRTEQGRKSAMLRIVTGGTNFRREFHE